MNSLLLLIFVFIIIIIIIGITIIIIIKMCNYIIFNLQYYSRSD